MSSHDRNIEAIELSGEHYGEFELLVKADNLYRIVQHNPDGTEEIVSELLGAEEAIMNAEIHNDLHRNADSWHEVISYSMARTREKRAERDEDINDVVEARLKQRLARSGKKLAKKTARRKAAK